MAENEGTPLVERMVLELTTCVCSRNGTHPLLAFVWRLVELTKITPGLLKLGPGLADWFHEAAARINCNQDGLQALKVRATEELLEPQEMHLIVRLARVGDDCYEFRAWRIIVNRGTNRWDDEDLERTMIDLEEFATLGLDPTKGTIQRSQLESLIEHTVNSLEDHLEYCENALTIELCLPTNLLLCDADRWQVDHGMGVKSSLGAQWRFVLRSWERAYGRVKRHVVGEWKKAWTQHSSNAHHTCAVSSTLPRNTGGPVQHASATSSALYQAAHEFADELANVANDPEHARMLAKRARFPRRSLPDFKSAQVFWNTIVEEMIDGKSSLEGLADVAMKQFPENDALRNCSEKIKGISANKVAAADPFSSASPALPLERIQQAGTPSDRGPTEALEKTQMFAIAPATAIFLSTPLFDHDKDDYPELNKMLMAGVSIAIWPRKDQCQNPCVQDVVSRIAESPVTRWRDAVRECRQEAQGEEDHAGDHLNILWDDPLKLPPDAHRAARARQMPRA